MYANDVLAHHGILGMKWGVRRYQNEDGSLTEAGRKHYYNSDGTYTKAGMRKARKDIIKERKNANKNRALLSDEELDKRVARMQKEQQLNQLTETNVSRGRRWLNRTEENVGSVSMQKLVVEGTVAAVATVGASYLKDYLKSKIG